MFSIDYLLTVVQILYLFNTLKFVDDLSVKKKSLSHVDSVFQTLHFYLLD